MEKLSAFSKRSKLVEPSYELSLDEDLGDTRRASHLVERIAEIGIAADVPGLVREASLLEQFNSALAVFASVNRIDDDGVLIVDHFFLSGG